MYLNRNCYKMLTFIAQMRGVKALPGWHGNCPGSTLRAQMVRRVRVELDDAPEPLNCSRYMGNEQRL